MYLLLRLVGALFALRPQFFTTPALPILFSWVLGRCLRWLVWAFEVDRVCFQVPTFVEVGMAQTCASLSLARRRREPVQAEEAASLKYR